MRFAAALSLVAEKIVIHLFQPASALRNDSGVREELISYAEADPNTEREFRSTLLGLLPDNRADSAKERRQEAQRKIWKALSDLVGKEARVANELRNCIQAAQEFWDVTKSRQDLYFFNHEPYFEGDPDTTMRFPAEEVGRGQNGALAQQPEAAGPVILVVFPHLYTVDRQILPALVVRESQVQGAMNETSKGAGRVLRHTSTSRRHAPSTGGRS